MTYSSGTPDSLYLYFTHKELTSKVTKHYFGANATNSKELYTYNNDGTFIATKTEIPADTQFDDVARKTEYVYAHEVSSSSPYSDMKRENLRSQIAQVKVKSIIDSTTPLVSIQSPSEDVAATATTWKVVPSNGDFMYLPDTEYHWRRKDIPAELPVFDWSAPPGECSTCPEWMLAQTFATYDIHGNQKVIRDAYGVETTIYWNTLDGTLIDSITTRPNASTTLTTKYAYDPNNFRLTSITDPNNQKTQFKYDPLQRLIETIMPDKRKASDLAYYYSRQGANNNDGFNPVDPNYIKTRSMSGHGFFESFEYTDAPENHGWGVHYGAGKGTMSTVYDNVLQSRVMRIDVNPGYGNQDYAVRYPATGNLGLNFNHLWVKTKSSAGTSSFRIIVARDSVEYALRYYLNSGTNGYDPVTRFVTIFLGAEFNDGNWRAFERDLEQDFKMTALSTGYNFIKRIVAVGEYDLDDVQLINHPVTTLAFADGLGRDIQTLQYDQGGAIKSGTFYDALDRVTKVTKPFFQTNRQFTRVDSVIAYANAYYATQHPVYYDSPTYQEYDTGNYAYTETEYYADPLNRVRHQYAAGTVFSRADTNFIKYQYGANAAIEMGIANANSVFETKTFDENDVKTEIFTDAFGNKVAVRVDSGNTDVTENTTKLATAFKYDILNNLLEIIPPKAFWADNNTISSSPDFKTFMSYNSLSQMKWRKPPDADSVLFLYDKNGNLRFMRDGKSLAANYFIYYKYDGIGRKIAEGRLPIAGNFNQANADDPTFPPEPEGTIAGDTVKVIYQYDHSIYFTGFPQRNLKGRLANIIYRLDRFPAMRGYMHHSYDVNGNIEWIQQHLPKNNVNDLAGLLSTQIDYQYDALGKVTKTRFGRGFLFSPGTSPDLFYVWYDYDVLGRLEKVWTNTADVKPATPNAQYTYWPSGQVKRLVLGNTVQGIDYLYNSRDWLTQINHQNFSSAQDPGGDGGGGGVPNLDKFGQIIGYNKQWHIATGHSDFVKQLNGNISWTITRTFGNTQPVGANLTGWVFKYDQANRLTKANWGHWSSGWQTSNRYDLTGILYDRNGNLEYMDRYDQNNAVTNMNYIYQTNTNKLLQVDGLPGHNPNNYAYDNNGNMIKDVAKLGNTSNTISYDYRNLPYKVPKTNGTIDFGYDGKGQRVSKNNLFYVPGADGRVIAVYDVNGTHLYWNIWGLDLIGQRFWKQ